MPYKRKDSPYLYVRKKLPGYGDTGPISTRVTTKKAARDMERLLEDVANWSLLDPTWRALLDAVCRERAIELPELLLAKNRNALDSLKASLNDPLLSECIAEFRGAMKHKKPTRVGLDKLEELAPKNAKLSDLTPQLITKMCHAYEMDVKRNSVRRYLLRAISLLLRFKVGNIERDRIFADVIFPAVSDAREIHLSPEQIASLLSACSRLGYLELEIAIRLMLLTSADRGVVFAGKRDDGFAPGLRVRDVVIHLDTNTNQYQSRIFLRDTKTRTRQRTAMVGDYLSRELLALCKGKGDDDHVFSMSYSQVDYRWQRVRKAANLEYVRLKDLRHQYAIYGEEVGIPQTVLMRSMGHTSEAMTRRYQSRSVVMSPEDTERLERAMMRKAS